MARRPLTRQRILRAALKLIDRDGLDALSMRKLGATLGVEGMALYRHVGSKGRLLEGVAELLLEQLDVRPTGSASWIDADHPSRSRARRPRAGHHARGASHRQRQRRREWMPRVLRPAATDHCRRRFGRRR